jgi:tRNA pseudouridine13 synthase
LLGNSFHIGISAISHSRSVIRKWIAQVVEELESAGGAPNFFGHQRFGTTRPITHLVGKAIVKKDFNDAVTLFLAKPSPHEHPSSREAREALQTTHDFKEASHNFPKQLRYEHILLRHLTEKPDDYVGAVKRLPIKLQELFIQAYQSYLFNRFLSKRIASGLGLNKAEVGDYVVNVERSGLPMVTMHKMADAGNLAEINEMIQAGKMRLALPLVGFRQRTSQAIQGEIEKQILEEEDIRPENFKIKVMPEIAGRGELRTAITPLNNFSLDEIHFDSKRNNRAKVSFMLYRGSYATIILRELMKTRNPIKAGF